MKCNKILVTFLVTEWWLTRVNVRNLKYHLYLTKGCRMLENVTDCIARLFRSKLLFEGILKRSGTNLWFDDPNFSIIFSFLYFDNSKKCLIQVVLPAFQMMDPVIHLNTFECIWIDLSRWTLWGGLWYDWTTLALRQNKSLWLESYINCPGGTPTFRAGPNLSQTLLIFSFISACRDHQAWKSSSYSVVWTKWLEGFGILNFSTESRSSWLSLM